MEGIFGTEKTLSMAPIHGWIPQMLCREQLEPGCGNWKRPPPELEATFAEAQISFRQYHSSDGGKNVTSKRACRKTNVATGSFCVY